MWRLSYFYQLLNTSIKYSEQELVKLLQQRDDQSFSYLYDNYSAALYGIINQIVTDKEIANDVLQEVFINIWKKIGLYDPSKGRLFTWMLNIARNASIDKLRSKGYQQQIKNQSLPENVLTMSGQTVNPNIDNIGLKKIIATLKTEHRVLVELSYFQGYTHEEIAKALDMPLGTVKTRIRSALIQLRTLIK